MCYIKLVYVSFECTLNSCITHRTPSTMSDVVAFAAAVSAVADRDEYRAGSRHVTTTEQPSRAVYIVVLRRRIFPAGARKKTPKKLTYTLMTSAAASNAP